MENTVLAVEHLCKYYEKVKALDDVSLSFREGEVHALVGENGAGKSTLIKMITGAIEPSGGTISICGKEYEKLSPAISTDMGISAIYQEFNLVPYLTVAENIFFGRELMKGPFTDKARMNQIVAEEIARLGIKLRPTDKVGNLGVAYCQIVEILKAVMSNGRILITDEPTAPLTTKETEMLFRIIAQLKREHVTILFISHRLEEVFAICDRVTVMRDGKHIATHDVKDVTRKQLVAEMVGRELGEQFPDGGTGSEDVVLEVRNFSNSKIHDVSFQLHKGEILGFGGLVGAGRSEVMHAIFGADPITSGTIYKNGKEIHIKNPTHAFRMGIGLIPEDRKTQGGLLRLRIRENITFSNIGRTSKGIFVNRKLEDAAAEYYRKKLRIKAADINQLLKNLSGGNQQKVILARILQSDCDILILDEPTRGIDVGAKQEIYALMRELVEKENKSIIMISSEMPELLGMSDRIVVMNEGKVVGELTRDMYSQERILEYAQSNGGI